MCGICGYINYDLSNKADPTIIKGMSAALVHRGPDDEGMYINNNVGLGHRRLSIIDVHGGHQPIFNEDKTIVIVLNGEIYNFPEIKENLQKKGHIFYTNTDTEVIVHLYEDLAEDCLHELNGMFAFAIWDNNNDKLFLARDRIGIKPLHYTTVNNQLIFASEIKAILRHPSVKKKLSLKSLSKYLTFEYIPAPDTIYEDIKKLLPGHFLVYSNKNIKLSPYWNLDYTPEKDKDRSEEDYAKELRELLKKSVKRELISDVPLGAFLSGGIDSSSIVAFMSELSPGNVKTFSIGFEEASFDESAYAEKVARYFGTQHYQQILSPDVTWKLIPKIIEILDEPFGDASIIPTYLLSEFTRKHVTVSLSGDGGDELFAGYPTYQAHKIANLYKILPSFIKKGILNRVINSLPVSFDNISFDFKLKKFIEGVEYVPEIRNYIWLGSFSPAEKMSLLTPKVLSQLDNSDEFENIFMYLKDVKIDDFIHKILFLDMKFYLQDDMLVKVDRASMAVSLEARVPLLDHTLVEFVTKLPSNLKLNKLTSKYIFKKSMKDILPLEIIKRKKKGFGIPVAKWIRNEIKDLVLDTLEGRKIKDAGLFNYNYIKNLLEQHFEGKKDHRKKLWTLLIFQLWYEKIFG